MDRVVNEDMATASAPGNGRFIIGLAWGFLFGMGIALLLAPRTGAEMRNQIRDSANRASRRARDTYDRAAGTMTEVAGRAATMAEDLTERAASLTAKLNTNLSSRPQA